MRNYDIVYHFRVIAIHKKSAFLINGTVISCFWRGESKENSSELGRFSA